MPFKKQSSITKARGKLRPFHMAVILVFLLLIIAASGMELWRQQNPAETLFDSGLPDDANVHFRVLNPAGRSQDFFSFTGRTYLLLYVWNTDCLECLPELEALSQLNTIIPRDQLRVLPVATDEDAKAVVAFMQKHNLMNLPPYRDDKSEGLTAALKTAAVPARYLINPNGELMGLASRPVPWNDPRVMETLRANTLVSSAPLGDASH